MRPETMARPEKTVRPEQKTKVRPEAKASDRQTNKVFSSSLTPQFGSGMGLRGQQYGASRRRQRSLPGLRQREATVLKPEKGECPRTAGREKQRPWATNESERPQAKRNRKPGAKNETQAKTKTPYRQGQGEPEGRIKSQPPEKGLRKATETVSKEKIGGACRASSGAKSHPENKSGDRKTQISAGEAT